MLLALNIGNTHTGYGLFDSKFELIFFGKRPTHPLPSSGEEFLSLLDSITSDFSPGVIGAEGLSENPRFSANPLEIVASSVVPKFTELLRNHCSTYILNERSPYSFEIGTDHCQAGTDRLANIEACLRLFGAPCIVVDAGTATTFSVAAESPPPKWPLTPARGPDCAPVFLGGAIAAGLGLATQALTQHAAQIPYFELRAPSQLIGRNTQDALLSGTVLGHALMIDSMIHGIKQELETYYQTSESPKVILTGGLGALLLPLLKEVDHHDPFLTLRGIAYVYDRIRKREPQLRPEKPENPVRNHGQHRGV